MRSPFPGMDPYLEAHGGDVHSRIVLYVSDALGGQLPSPLYSRVEERVVIESEEESFHRKAVPDVRIVEYPSGWSDPGGGTATAVVADVEAGVATEPFVVSLPDEETTERFIEIRDAGSGHRVVTVIEVLSPGNKRPGDGRVQITEKLAAFRAAGVSFVEIDLLRAGEPIVPAGSPLARMKAPYRACVVRGERPWEAEVYPIPLEQPLPIIHIPLRPTDNDAKVDLQRIVSQAYRNGNYALTTDYRQPPEPPLNETQTQWAQVRLKGRIGEDGRVSCT